MSKKTLYVDIECYRNFFYIAFKRMQDGKRLGFEFSARTGNTFDREHVRALLLRNLTIGFNSNNYDLPMIVFALTGASLDQLKEASDLIIKGGLKPWDVPDALGIIMPKKWDHIDLIEPNPAVMTSLKTLNGRLHGDRLQDLPYREDTILSYEEMDNTADYCLISDLDATENLHKALREPLELRTALSEQYKRDFRSKSDAQIGEAIVKMAAEEILDRKIQKKEVKATHFKYDVPDFIKFETPYLKQVLQTIRTTTIYTDHNGKVQFPEEWEKFKIQFGDTEYKLGIGGLHSKESCRGLRSDDDFVLVDADVASQYPSIIMKLGLYPLALGRTFLKVYGGVIASRLAAKARAKAIKEELEDEHLSPVEYAALKRELGAMTVIDKGAKIQLNGVYGKLGSKYSVLYAPHLMIAVTLTGQLSLLMLIEKAEKNGIHVVSGNTDGVVFQCPREHYAGIDRDVLKGGKLKEITDWWEGLTGFKLEFAEYASIWNRDVNCYIAIKPNGKAKRKGTIANHWHPDSPDFDQRSQLSKNPQMTIIGDAALEHILNGTPVEDYIRKYDDIRGFLTVINATGGATWRKKYLGKVVRFYWSTDGDPIIKVKANPQGTLPKVPKTDGCRPMMRLADKLPGDIDYDRYIEETYNLLRDVGFLPPMQTAYDSPSERKRIKAGRSLYEEWAMMEIQRLKKTKTVFPQ